jgi:hypothetical protein
MKIKGKHNFETRPQLNGTDIVTTDDSRLSDARTPTSHASTHNAGGGDALAIDAAAATGSLRTLGTFSTSACAGNDSRLSDARIPTSHTHGNITNAGAIGSTANLPLITTTSGVITTATFGTGANTFCQGNDSRLSDSRTPTSHASTHVAAGGDAITISESQVTNLTTDLGNKVTANVAITGATNTKITYDSKGLVTSGTSLATTDIPSLDAAKISSGVFDIARIPASALERLVQVVDQAARYALTTATVQNGDTVKQLDTQIMYVVVDDTNLNNASGYVSYTAGSAAPAAALSAQYIDWNASSGGASIANKPTLGTAAAKNIPATGNASATEVVYGSDTRLADDRTASGIRSATTIVAVSSASAPSTGQVLTATSTTAATWQTPVTGVTLATTDPADVTKAVAAVGVGTTAARADHKHNVTTATASSNPPGTSNAEGTATSLARSDHTHAIPAYGTAVSTICQGNDSRLSDARTPTAHASTHVNGTDDIQSATASQKGLATATQITKLDGIAPGATANVITNTAPVDVTKATAAVGTSTELARQDHKHDVSTATASSNPPGTSNAEGTATSLSRSDHTHAIPAYGAAVSTICQGNDSRLSDDRTASGIRTATTVVSLSSATAPTTGQVLQATGSAAATWQDLPVFGTQFNTNSLTPAFTTTSTTLTPAHSFTTPTLPAGTYRVEWCRTMKSSAANSNNTSSYQIDTVVRGTNSVYRPANAVAVDIETKVFHITFATSATHVLTLQVSASGGTLSVFNSDITIWRIS